MRAHCRERAQYAKTTMIRQPFVIDNSRTRTGRRVAPTAGLNCGARHGAPASLAIGWAVMTSLLKASHERRIFLEFVERSELPIDPKRSRAEIRPMRRSAISCAPVWRRSAVCVRPVSNSLASCCVMAVTTIDRRGR